jgi:hypothetical protein
MSDTPETDAIVRNAATADHPPTRLAATLTVKCEKLERERDEAREIIKIVAQDKDKTIEQLIVERDSNRKAFETLQGLYSNEIAKNRNLERDEARDVLREIAEASGFDNIGNWARNKARNAIYR